jgi:hypothetical protein
VVGRFRESISDDTRNDGCRRGCVSTVEGWIPSRLESYGQRDELPANEKIYRALVAAAVLVHTVSLKQESNSLSRATVSP